MIKIVKIRDKEIIIWEGGVCCKPIACLKSENTIISLVKEVTISKSVGAKTNSAKIIAIFIVLTNCTGCSIAATDRFIIGASAAFAKIEKSSTLKIILKKNPIKNWIGSW